jgi:hypothetical protein
VTVGEQRFFGFFLQKESAQRLKDIGALKVSKTLCDGESRQVRNDEIRMTNDELTPKPE